VAHVNKRGISRAESDVAARLANALSDEQARILRSQGTLTDKQAENLARKNIGLQMHTQNIPGGSIGRRRQPRPKPAPDVNGALKQLLKQGGYELVSASPTSGGGNPPSDVSLDDPKEGDVHLAWTGSEYQESVYSEGRWTEGHSLGVQDAEDYLDFEGQGVSIQGGPVGDGKTYKPKVSKGSQIKEVPLSRLEATAAAVPGGESSRELQRRKAEARQDAAVNPPPDGLKLPKNISPEKAARLVMDSPTSGGNAAADAAIERGASKALGGAKGKRGGGTISFSGGSAISSYGNWWKRQPRDPVTGRWIK